MPFWLLRLLRFLRLAKRKPPGGHGRPCTRIDRTDPDERAMTPFVRVAASCPDCGLNRLLFVEYPRGEQPPEQAWCSTLALNEARKLYGRCGHEHMTTVQRLVLHRGGPISNREDEGDVYRDPKHFDTRLDDRTSP